MTISFTRYCTCATTYEFTGPGSFTLPEGTLCVTLISSGRCEVVDAALAQSAGAGCIAAAPGHTQLLPGVGCHLLGVVLEGDAATEYAAGLQGTQIVNGTQATGAPELIAALASSLSPAEASAAAYTLLCRLSTAGSEEGSLAPLVAAAIAQIREHYAEVYGIEELAAGLGVSKSHLVRSFSAAMGIPPGRYLTGVRVEAAKRLLLRQDYSLDIIATLCGFSGANYLCKVFKKATGQSPGEYRKSMLAAAPAIPQPSEWEDMLFL